MANHNITSVDLKNLILGRMKEKKVDPKKIARAKQVRWPETGKPWQHILGTSTKVEKSRKVGMLATILYLAPALESLIYGGINLCPFASEGCSLACLRAKIDPAVNGEETYRARHGGW